MALCCIGGVCIPYTALLPLLVLGLQWLLQQLSAAGLLPTSWTSTLNQYLSMATGQQRGAKDSSSSSSCCGTNDVKSHLRRGKQSKMNDSSSCCADAEPTTAAGVVVHCTTEEEWERLVQRSTTTTAHTALTVKFTAAWCKPCQKIQLVFAALQQQNQNDADNTTTQQKIQLVTVDVDGCDGLAGSLQILSLPTFMLLDPRTQRPIGGPSSSYSGSDETRLQRWWESAIASVKKMS
jgi:thiol-disulfide isomerase/thioredoxin